MDSFDNRFTPQVDFNKDEDVFGSRKPERSLWLTNDI
jgi:hypothetical protein